MAVIRFWNKTKTAATINNLIVTAVFLPIDACPFHRSAASKILFVGLLTCASADIVSANQSSAFPVSQ
jgi:hypothetical protein